MLCSVGTAMSPRKNPKFRVAASSTKKPKMTFSRFIDHPLAERSGCATMPVHSKMITPGPSSRSTGSPDGGGSARSTRRRGRPPHDEMRGNGHGGVDVLLVLQQVEQDLRRAGALVEHRLPDGGQVGQRGQRV